MTIFDTSTDNGRRLMTTEEVIAYLRVNARTVYRLIQAGDLPAVRVGRQWRVRRADLDDWLERGRPATATAGEKLES
jgi:excisionase family DNA binding protein